VTLFDLLDRSAAATPFREAMLRFLHDGRSSERIRFGYGCPPVKVQRTLHKALVEYPALSIESIELQASSGCEYFRGTLIVRTATDERHIAFHWDCKWRAEAEGWRDWFGFPDQTRAAREFDWDCFRGWAEEQVIEVAPLVVMDQRVAQPLMVDAVLA
jgi:hypothetical protein